MKQMMFWARRPGLTDAPGAPEEVFRVALDNGDSASGKAFLKVVAEVGAAGGARQSETWEINWNFVRKAAVISGPAPSFNNVLTIEAESEAGSTLACVWAYSAASGTYITFSVTATSSLVPTAMYAEGWWMQSSPQDITVQS